MQLDHQSSRFSKKSFPIVLVCENISNSSNIGGLLRLADAFGVSKLIFIGQPKEFGHKVRRASRNTEKYVDYSFTDDAEEFLQTLKSDNYSIICLEITSGSSPINQWQLNSDEKIVLIIGNEADGISDRYLKMADKSVHIELFGQNSSINVTTATAIALQRICSRLNI